MGRGLALQLLSLLIDYPLPIGTLCFVLFAFVRLQFAPADRKRTELFLVTAALSMPISIAAVGIVVWMGTLPIPKLDLYVFRIDGLLGFQPSFALGQFVQPHFWMEAILNVTYGSLTCAAVFVFGFYVWHCEIGETIKLLRTFLLNLFLAVPFYFLFPVCGPAFAFPSFPFNVPHNLIPHAVSLFAPPNGVPSVHMSTAILIAWFSWRWVIGRLLSVTYLILTVIVTLASGQHYLFDLVTALPYTALMIYLGGLNWRSHRHAETHEPELSMIANS